MKIQRNFVGIGIWVIVSLMWNMTAWAITTPQPRSGGQFFRSKGTRAAPGDLQRLTAHREDPAKGIDAGWVRLHPFFGYTGEWDSNVFLSENDEQDDWIHRFFGGTAAETSLDGGRHLLSGQYEAMYELFDRFSGEDHLDHKAEVAGDFNFVPFSISAQDTYRMTSDRSDTEFTERVRRDENTADVLLEVPFTSFFIETEMLNHTVNFRSDDRGPLDRNEWTIYPRLGFDISPRTQLLAEYGHTEISYPHSDRDGAADQVSGGLRGHLTERMVYQAWAGFQSRIYDRDESQDFNDFVFRGAVHNDLTVLDRLILEGDRTPEESVFDGQNYYVRNRAVLTWRRKIAERFYLNLKGRVQYNEYTQESVVNGESKTRDDYWWSPGVGLEYRMPNDIVSIVADYRFNARDSNIAGLDYDQHVASAGVKAVF